MMINVEEIPTVSVLVDGVRHHEDDRGNYYIEKGEDGILTYVGSIKMAPPEVIDALHPKAPWED